MQIIFQDPYASLDPRAPIGDSIADGLRIHGVYRARSSSAQVAEIMDKVGLAPYQARRYPHEFSGGQRQRIGIARALVLKPDLIVCDEPVSALDVSIQAQVLNLLKELQAEMTLTLVFIAHNMGVVEHISDRVAVMYLGRIVELSDRADDLPRSAPPIHAGADVGHPAARSGGPAQAHHPARRRAQPGQHPGGLPLQPALLAVRPTGRARELPNGRPGTA